MRLKLAYLGVVLVWTTTPLGVKWSSDGLSFVLGVTARMSIGLACLLLLMLATRQRLAFHRAARWTYLAVTVQLYLSMLITYWAAQFIPSGWLSVIFGLSPFMTAFMAAAFLKERSLGWLKVSAYLLGFAGLMVMFLSALDLNEQALLGVAGMLLSTLIHSASAVWVKRIDARLPAVQQITGGLLCALPLYLVSWYVLDHGRLPAEVPEKTLYAIVYLGTVATTLGFALYYYLLSRMPATNVAMINLMTPLLSLLLGYGVNQEPLTLKIAIGTGLIMTALLIHEAADRRQRFKTVCSG
ncbi:MAG: DMT family transporter [Methylococcaceae bacterium]|nr:DMT family transporter [Methylococcaceae bacterium]